MYSGRSVPANLSSSSSKKDWRIASDEKEKIDRKQYAIAAERAQTTAIGGIGETTVTTPA
jgi:hypothetical protein